MKIKLRMTYGNHPDAVWKQSVKSLEHPVVIKASGSLECNDLVLSVNTSICSARGGDPDRMLAKSRERLLQKVLDCIAMGLALKSVVRTTYIAYIKTI
jgi:hypothetical protein